MSEKDRHYITEESRYTEKPRHTKELRYTEELRHTEVPRDTEGIRFRNHISIIAEQVGGGIAGAVILFFVTVIQDVDLLTDLSHLSDLELTEAMGAGPFILLGVLALLAGILINRFLVWAHTYICIEENAVVIERNTINRKKNTIGIRNISNINLEQSLFERLLGTCKVKIDTNSRSTADSTDVVILLKKDDASYVRQKIMERMYAAEPVCDCSDGAQPFEAADPYSVRTDFGDIIQHGIFSINILSVLVVIGGVAAAVSSLLRLLEQPDIMQSLLGAAAGILVVASLVFSALWDTLKDFIRYYDFRAGRTGDRICLRYGLLKKMEYTIPVEKIQALKIRQTFIARLTGRYMAEIVNIGMGDEKEEQNSFLVLYCTRDRLREQLRLLLPEYADAAEWETGKMPPAAWAAWTIPAAVTAAVTSAFCGGLALALPEHRRLIGICCVLLLLLLLGQLALRYGAGGMAAGEDALKLAEGCFGRSFIVIKYADIQFAEFKQNPIARTCGIRHGSVRLLAAAGDTAHHIPYFQGDGGDRIRAGMMKYE